ncbi:MAG: hypothetical protein P4M15_13450 [Alphaproteobacteria bacterium]|nr:hypothetical protein [Alphaproteobacteria bacterium]
MPLTFPYSGGGGGAGGTSFSGVNTQAANYTAALTDIGKLVVLSSASAIAFTVPPNSSVAFPVGTVLNFQQGGAGALSVAAGAGVTINKLSTLNAVGSYAIGGLVQIAADSWILYGAMQ